MAPTGDLQLDKGEHLGKLLVGKAHKDETPVTLMDSLQILGLGGIPSMYLCAGIGEADEGLRPLFRTVLSVDSWEVANRVHEANGRGGATLHADITSTSGHNTIVRRLQALQDEGRAVRAWFGGLPCQAESRPSRLCQEGWRAFSLRQKQEVSCRGSFFSKTRPGGKSMALSSLWSKP